MANHVYKLDKGWSFDGAYMPHFYFNNDPAFINGGHYVGVGVYGTSDGAPQLACIDLDIESLA